MATEDIRFNDGRITVDRAGNKENVDVAVSDVESVTFARSAGNDPQGDGSLVLHTGDGDVVIRVANDDAGKVLASLGKAQDTKKPTKDSTAK
jgi:hypothetical protein